MIAILSDIHANALALEAVLEDMRTLDVSRALCLGDTIGYGPDAAECVKLVREHCVASVLGNHEAMLIVLERIGPQDLGDTVFLPLKLAQKQLSADHMKWMTDLPIGIDFDAFEIIHASLHEPGGFNYIDSEEKAGDHFLNQKRPVSFCGHTHVPAVWENSGSGRITCYAPIEKMVRLDPDRKYAVNVGSVGQPRDGNIKASYVIYDHAEGFLLHRRVDYDIAAAQKRFRKAALPAHNAQRLAKAE